MPLVYRSREQGYQALARIMSHPRNFDHGFYPVASVELDAMFRASYPKVSSGVVVMTSPTPRLPRLVESASPRTIEAALGLVGLADPKSFKASEPPKSPKAPKVDTRLARELAKLATSHRNKPIASIVDCSASLELPQLATGRRNKAAGLPIDRMAVSFLAPPPLVPSPTFEPIQAFRPMPSQPPAFDLMPSLGSAFETVGRKRAFPAEGMPGRPAKLRALPPAAGGVPELSLGAPSMPSVADLMASLPAFRLADCARS